MIPSFLEDCVNGEMRMEQHIQIIVPILPGKAEAWRRFLQEIEGLQADEFAHWCKNLNVEVQRIALHVSLGGGIVLLSVFAAEPNCVLAKLAQHSSPFNHWLIDQAHRLHGLDLNRIYI